MATSADDLLQQAQQELYAATQELPSHWYGRGAAATQALDAYTAAWPTLAGSYLHILRPELFSGEIDSLSASTNPDKPSRLDALRLRLQDIAQSDIERVGNAEPDQHLMRVAELTNAAGDALDVVRNTQPGIDPAFGTMDRALSTLDHAARVTAVYAENSTQGVNYRHVDSRQWLWISASAQAAATSPDPTARSSGTGSIPIISSDDASLTADLDRWRGAASAALEPTDSPTARLPLIAATLATTHSAAAALGIDDTHRKLAEAWGAAANAWQGGAIRLPGPDDLELRTHTRNLRSALDQLVHQHQSGTPSPTAGQDRQALASFLQHQAPAIEAGYRNRTLQQVQSMRPIIAARALARSTPGPTPPRLANAARTGKWIPLPPNSHQAQHLQKTTIAASRTLTQPEEPLPQLSAEEVAQARQDRQPGSVKKARVNMQQVQRQIAALREDSSSVNAQQRDDPSPQQQPERSQGPRQ